MPHDEPTAPTPDDERSASPEIVLFFLGPDGERLDEPSPGPPRNLTDLFRTWRSTLEAERSEEQVHRHVVRQVQGTGRAGKHGYRDEIVVTLRSRPTEAVPEALADGLFEPPLRWLRVDPDSLTAGRYELDWRAEIRVRPWRGRRARLRLYASPSLNVTVLSLFPAKPRAVARRRFLQRGLAVMNDLRDRIDDRVERSSRPVATHDAAVGAG